MTPEFVVRFALKGVVLHRDLFKRAALLLPPAAAEMNHFHSNRIYDYNRVMQQYLEEQAKFYETVRA